MRPEQQHHSRAVCNERFADSLDCSDPTNENWAVVSAFYAALHYVQSYFEHHSIICGEHTQRKRYIKNDSVLRAVFTEYDYLYTLSRTARYKFGGLPTNPYRKAKEKLEKVKATVEGALSTVVPVAVPESPTCTSFRSVVEEDQRPSPGKPL